ncbi:MAG: response regulator transcription factor [Gammaproteobacteria bacterium]|nr:response regulator transcription factor [Gammaproteobacteria bacterium]
MKIVLIDDHALFRTGIATMLHNLEPETESQGFGDSTSAVDAVNNPEEVDLVLLDYHIPGTDTGNNIQTARDYFPNAKLVIISGEEDSGKIIKAIDCGASGFIPKSSEPQVLIAALRLVLSGGVYLPAQVLQAQPVSVQEAASNKSALDQLTQRQQEVLKHAIYGKTNKTIARELGLSEGTIKAHLSSAYRSLGVQKRSEAVVIASQLLDLHRG